MGGPNTYAPSEDEVKKAEEVVTTPPAESEATPAPEAEPTAE